MPRFTGWTGLTLLTIACAALVAKGDEPDTKDVVEYGEFALSNKGDAERGKRLFEHEKLRCHACHTIGADERKAGPDLLGIADKYDRGQLIRSILKPRDSILAGYGTLSVETRSGTTHTGIVKRRSDAQLELWVDDGKVARLARGDIELEQSSAASLMPEGLHRQVSPSDFADLVAYLERLKNPKLYPGAATATPDVIPPIAKPIRFEPFHDDGDRMVHPVWFAPVPGVSDSFVVVENDPAKIWLLQRTETGSRKSLFLDLKEEIHTGQHMGLMGFAFHPRFVENRKYYLNHHFKTDGSFGTLIVERLASSDFRTDAGIPSRVLLQIPQNTDLHTGGMVGFGPDGYLYIGTGDGGPQTDPEGNAQNLRLLQGSILRIDVDQRDDEREYAIPESNPFFGHADPAVRQEIWARGLRQAWRFSWDSLTSDLWVGDVGQNRFEEITIVRRGESHGWNVFEGFLPFSDRYLRKGVDHVPPVVALARKHGASVTGGYVYRGTRSPSFDGVYVFGDYESKRIWGLTQRNRELIKIRQLGIAPDRITSFATGTDGELFLLGYDEGMIYRLVLDETSFE